jgi:TDG/mug DNA glycosylase family protein
VKDGICQWGENRRVPRNTSASAEPRPTAAQLEAARDSVIPDVIAPDLEVLFCGINPGLWSGVVARHFARPGNRFWPALYAAGFTPELFTSVRQDELPALGLGISNVVARATARADELRPEEFREGARILTAKAAEYRPAWIAIVGITAYRVAFDRRTAQIGRQQERIADSRVWVLPNPSGLNASWTAPRLSEAFRELHDVAYGDAANSDEAANG